MTEIPYFFSDELTDKEARQLVKSMDKNGFEILETSMGNGEVVRLYSDINGNEILVIADNTGVEATADYPAGPVIRDRG